MESSERKSANSEGPEGRWAGLLLPINKPSVFFAFKHSPTLLEITKRMLLQLAQLNITAIRLIDYPLPGTNLRERARSLIRSTDGTVLFWSEEARQSQWVRDEYETARKFNRAVCLILLPGVSPPDDWNPDVEWVSLEGFSPQSQSIRDDSAVVGEQVTNKFLFERMMNKIKAFADYNHELRRFRILSFVTTPLIGVKERELELCVTVAGGTPPYTFSYSGLPPGLVTANVPRIRGVSKSLGWFLVTVSVQDAVGRVTQASTKFQTK